MIAGCLQNQRGDIARKLFNEMPVKDVFTWTLMITCCVRNGEVDKGREFFEMMGGGKGNVENVACWNAMISGYVSSGRVEEGRRMFDEMGVKDLVTWNTMLGGYVKRGEMGVSLRFFEEMPVKDVVSWNLMVDGFVEVGDLESAWSFFERIPDPNVVSWVTMLSGFGKYGRVVEARRLFDQMPVKNVVAWNAMIGVYVQNTRIDEALSLFNEMPEKNAVSWTSMINGYVRVGKLEEASELLERMPYKNVGAQTAMISGFVQNKRLHEARDIFNCIGNRDTVCWNTMISGYAQNGLMDEAHGLFQKMPRKDAVSWNTMIAGYAQVGQMDKALALFDNTKHKNIVTWNSLISGFTHNGLYPDAFKYLVMMIQDGYRPDESTYASVLSSCANLAALQHGTQAGYEQDIFVTNSLITMYAKCGKMASAKLVFFLTPRVDVVSWNSLIDGYALNGNGIEAVRLVDDMEIAGVIPDEVTFIGALSACSHAGLINEGFRLLELMTKKYLMQPLPEHYACIVDLLGRAGRLETAFKMANEMKTDGNVGMWGALLDACRAGKDLNLAKFAAKKLLEIEPEKGSNYVMLSNLNAEAGRWEVVEKVRDSLKEKRTLKQPGCSWIEVQNQVHVFVSGDGLWLENMNFRGDLRALMAHIRNAGETADNAT
nr:hypothetical protein [Tanacetum cinerariifolium]